MQRYMTLCISVILIAAGGSLIRAEAVPAFPGAEGFGANAQGGRGGRVIAVTNLNDRGVGSLRACVEDQSPRTCVFRVAGHITVKQRIEIRHPYITIAGQTAPGDGITLRIDPSNDQGPLSVKTHDVIIRYLRFRPGNGSHPPIAGETNTNIDAITIGNSEAANQVYNVMIDHCSFSWATDENVNIWNDTRDLTMQWNIISEALHCVAGNAECHSKGLLIASKGSKRISIHHNLLAHNVGRNPLIKSSGTIDLVNNVIHVPYHIAGAVDDAYGPFNSNWVGNYLQANSEIAYGVWDLNTSSSCGTKFYLKNNIDIRHKPSLSDPESRFVHPANYGRNCIVSSQFDAASVTTTSPFQAFDEVLAGAGATLPTRDAIDKRVINEVKNQEYRVVDDPAQVGGWPAVASVSPAADTDHDGMADSWELTHFGTLARGSSSDSSGDFDGDGYTDLEEYLNGTDPTNPNNNRGSIVKSFPPTNLRIIP